jgi:hypothetical protein
MTMATDFDQLPVVEEIIRTEQADQKRYGEQAADKGATKKANPKMSTWYADPSRIQSRKDQKSFTRGMYEKR